MGCNSCPAKELLNKSNQTTDSNTAGCGKLNTHDWMDNLPQSMDEDYLVEVSFKNTRKEFFVNKNKLSLKRGDYIAVAAANGHDVGKVSLTGKMAVLQLKKKKPKNEPDKVIYRKATQSDIEKWHKSRLREKPVMIKARKCVEELNLKMKISDVEFQGDGNKAIFYYIAEGRVDFRELIKIYAREFSVRIEMKQIGARQEAAMVGGLGSCGNELCCSSWRSNLDSVSANAAKIQDLPHNIQKLTGQCGKLKCCLMYELDTYIEAQDDFPDMLLELEFEGGIAYPRKKEVLKKVIWYSMSAKTNNQLFSLPLSRVKEIIMLNKKGEKPSIPNNDVPVDFAEPEFKSFENDLDILTKKKTKKPFRKKRKKNPPKNNTKN